MTTDKKHFTSSLGILADSQYYPGGWIDKETGNQVVAQEVDFAANWPLSALEKDVHAGLQLATDEAEKRDYENLRFEILAAKNDIAKFADKELAEQLIYWGIGIGQKLARIEVRPDRKSVNTGRTIRKVNAIKGGKTAKLTPAQWKEVENHIRAETKRGVSAKQVCIKVSAQLSTANFAGLPQVNINISPRALQKRWTDRNK